MRRAERGLTMLEVLGAAALLAFAYIALTRSEIEGLRSEQESNRRLQASLLADEQLADLELAMASGSAPPLGKTEKQEDFFRVRTEVRAFEPPPPRPAAERLGLREGSLAERRAAHGENPDAPSLFKVAKPGDADPPLRTLEVVVQWNEGIYEREVRRTTFAMDPIAVEGLLSQVVKNAPDAEDEGSKDESSQQAGKTQSSKKKQKDRKQTGDEPRAPRSPPTTPGFPEGPDGPPDGFSR